MADFVMMMKGTEAVAEAAIRAGCRFFAGYPITPQNEVPEYMARKQPKVGGVFIQGESEVASISMVYGAASAGVRAMASSSSCGISLKSEGIAFLAGSRLPAVIANFQRGGPGIGSIQPSQQDYTQATKASGNGGFRMIVYAPSTIQEAVDFTYAAFDTADKYLNPVMVLLDGFTGTMMEPVELPPAKSDEEVKAIRDAKTWKTTGRNGEKISHEVMCGANRDRRYNLMHLNIRDTAMYEKWQEDEVDWEEVQTEDAELIITAYGISGRIAKSAVDLLRQDGYKVGLIRPKKIHPFPVQAYEKLDFGKLKGILSVEMSIPAQFAVDVINVVKDRTPVDTVLTSGGIILDRDDIIDKAKQMYGER